MQVKIKMDATDRILLKRGLNKNGKAQKLFTNEVFTHCEPYVPKRGGVLRTSVQQTADKLIYLQPYAQRQYYENAGHGEDGTAFNGLRGKMWDKRMWADKGHEIVETVADYVGGKAK